MKSKINIVLFISMLVFISFFYSCKSSGHQKETSDEFLKEIIQEEASLSFSFMGSMGAFRFDNMQEVLAEAGQRSGLNITVDFKWYPPDEYFEKINSMTASKSEIEAFYCVDPSPLAFDFTELARRGALADLTVDMPEYCPDLYIRYDDKDLASVRYKGSIYAIPSLDPFSYSTYAFVREDLKEKYMIPEIDSFETYEYYLGTIKQNEEIIPGKMGGFVIDQFIGTSGYAILDPFLGLVYEWDDPKMDLTVLEDTPEFVEIAYTITHWNKNGYLHNLTTTDFDIWEATRKLVTSGQISSFMITPEFNPGLRAEYMAHELNRAIELSLPGSGAYVKAYRLYPEMKVQRVRGPMGLGWVGSAIAFSSQTENLERYLMFLNWIQSQQENYDLIQYGIKGKHYELKADNIALLSVDSSASAPFMGWPGHWAFKNIYFERVPAGFSSDFRDERLEYIESKTRYAPHEGFFHDTSLLGDLYEIRALSLAEYVYFPLLSGTFDVSGIALVRNSLAKAGSKEVEMIVQQQLDKWK